MVLVGREKFSAAISSDPVEACIEVICSSRGTSFVELEDVIRSRGVDVEGGEGIDILFDDWSNIVAWTCRNQGVADILMRVMGDPRIRLTETRTIVYIVDGKVPALPEVNRIPKNGYKDRHWMPVVFNPKAMENDL